MSACPVPAGCRYPFLRDGLISSGASHLEMPTAPGVAAIIDARLDCIVIRPYSDRRARPLREISKFVCSEYQHSVKALEGCGYQKDGSEVRAIGADLLLLDRRALSEATKPFSHLVELYKFSQ